MSSPSLLTRIRMGTVVGGLAAALVLTGCSSSDDGGDARDKGDSTASVPSAPAESSAEDAGSGSGAGSGAEGGTLEGSWLATTGGKTVALVITGKKAGLFDSGGTTCSGTAAQETGKQSIELKCTGGSNDRGQGTVDSVDDTTLKVTWEGFVEETYTRSKDGKLPQGLPTNGLGS